MKKFYFIAIFCLCQIFAYGEIKIKIFEPIRFEDIVNEEIGRNISVGTGVIEITTDNLEEDSGKKLVFNFPEKGAMTNKKKWINIEEYRLETKDREVIIKAKIQHVKIYAILDKKKIDSGEEPNIIEGEYIGVIPVVISQYGRVMK